MATKEKFDNKGQESNADALRNMVNWLDNRIEFRNDNKTISILLQEYFDHLDELENGE